jgi:putative FmdB family regulatory protein
MPYYDFRCKECDHQFTIRASFAEKDAGLHPICPTCEAVETEQLLTAGVLIGAKTGGASMPLPMAASGPSCGCSSCGCG